MTEKFIELFTNKINEYYTCYYEEAPSTVKFPYIVIPTITLTPLNNGYLCITDLFIYINELSEESIETICDTLRTNLDNFSILDQEKGIGFHSSFENQTISNVNEQDLSIRKISFASRLFEIKKEG